MNQLNSKYMIVTTTTHEPVADTSQAMKDFAGGDYTRFVVARRDLTEISNRESVAIEQWLEDLKTQYCILKGASL